MRAAASAPATRRRSFAFISICAPPQPREQIREAMVPRSEPIVKVAALKKKIHERGVSNPGRRRGRPMGGAMLRAPQDMEGDRDGWCAAGGGK